MAELKACTRMLIAVTTGPEQTYPDSATYPPRLRESYHLFIVVDLLSVPRPSDIRAA